LRPLTAALLGIPGQRSDFPGVADVLKRYQAKAGSLGIDPLGINFVPFGYAAGQVLAQSVEGTGSFDDGKRAQYMRSHSFPTVVGDVAFGPDGEWAKSRMFFTQFQNVAPNDLDQFRDGRKQIILWPLEYKTGDIAYPYGKAKAH